MTARVARAAAAGALCAAAACGSFESEDIVIDLRVLAMSASVPDQVVDISVDDPPEPGELLDQLVPSEVCALVADPNFDRRLSYSMTLCLSDGGRCDTGSPAAVLVNTLADDVELTRPAPRLCATVQPDGNLLGVLLAALEGDVFNGIGGIDYIVALRLGADGIDPALDLFASKTLRVAPRIPAARAANRNPTLDRIDAAIDGAAPVPLPLGRCVDQVAPLALPAGSTLRLTPVETAGVRESYVVPTLDGKSQTFTESLTYQWLAGAGSVSAGSTGGPRDISGNFPPLFTDYRTPRPADVAAPTDVALWIVQRDERLGVQWYESCVRVMPP